MTKKKKKKKEKSKKKKKSRGELVVRLFVCPPFKNQPAKEGLTFGAWYIKGVVY